MKLSVAFLLPLIVVAAVGCDAERPDDDELDPDSSSESESVTEQREPDALVGITAAHNEVRASVQPVPKTPLPDLSWDETVASTAQAYADKCVYGHSRGEYGENLYATAGKLATVDEVVSAWGDESELYDYETGACSGKCGHYTQIAWRDSTRLGCGVTSCKTGSPFEGFTEWQYWVCNYDPPGNWQGEKPY